MHFSQHHPKTYDIIAGFASIKAVGISSPTVIQSRAIDIICIVDYLAGGIVHRDEVLFSKATVVVPLGED